MQEDQRGEIRRVEGGFEARLVRFIEHDRESVWAMLTEPRRLAQWLAPGTIDLREGGAVRIDFPESGATIDSEVRAIEPGSLIEYSWSSGNDPERPLRWALAPAEGGVRLTLTLRLPAGEDVSKACAGWEAHLQMLLAALEGVSIGFPVGYFKEMREDYSRQMPA